MDELPPASEVDERSESHLSELGERQRRRRRDLYKTTVRDRSPIFLQPPRPGMSPKRVGPSAIKVSSGIKRIDHSQLMTSF